MDPLSLTFRRIVATLFFILFVSILVVASVYASGYRLDGLSLVSTGGVHVSVPINNAQVVVDGEEIGVSGFLTRSFFIDNLDFGTHTIEVAADGYYPWKKQLIVERSFVTDTSAFMVSEDFSITPVVIESNDAATTTRAVSEEVYDELLALFGVGLDEADVASSTEEVVDTPSVEVLVRDGNVYVHWNRELDEAPSAFCITPGACVIEISVELSSEEVVFADFFKSGVVYQTRGGKIVFAEVDVKQSQVVVELYQSPGALFRVQDGELFIYDDQKLFVVTDL